jgi:hypothetical protein
MSPSYGSALPYLLGITDFVTLATGVQQRAPELHEVLGLLTAGEMVTKSLAQQRPPSIIPNFGELHV